MKKLSILALTMSMSISALAVKVGYLNTEEVFQKYSQTKILQTNLQKEKTRLETEIKKKEVVLQKMQVELQSKGDKVTDVEKKKFEEEVKTFQKFVKDSQTKLGKEEMTRLQEIEININNSVKKIATAGKYDYVLEAGAVKFGGENVTSKVLAEMEKNVKKN
ncbi:MAG: OmpH family outer membrane protein [Fusobacteriaceae bacterium]